MNKVLLEVKNLKKYFQTPKGQLHAVDNVNFAIEEGKPWELLENLVVENLQLEEQF